MSEVYYADKDTPKVKTSTEKISALSYQNNKTDNKIKLYQDKFETNPTGQNLTDKQTDEKQKLIEQKIKLYEKIITQTKLGLINLQKEKDSGNNLTIAQIDAFMSLFSDNTSSKIYANTFEITKNQAKDILSKVEELLKDKNLTENYKTRLENVKNEIQIILKSNIKDTSLLTLTKNEILFMPEKIKLAAYGVKGKVIGVIDGAKNIITGFADLVVGIGKYAVYKEYREKIDTQIGQIYDFCEKIGFTGMKDIVTNAINTEIDRISKLPKEKQAEEIGKIAGNVIAIIGTFKVGGMVSNKLKVIPVVGETGTLGEKIKTGSIVTGLNTANVVINGPEEYLLKGAGKGIGMISDKISELVKTKGLSNITRIDLAESILGGIKLNKNQIDAIELAHKTENLLQKGKILKEAGFDEIQRDLLIRNYVCGGEISDILISIKKLEISEISNKVTNQFNYISEIINNQNAISEKGALILKQSWIDIKKIGIDENKLLRFEQIIDILIKGDSKTGKKPDSNIIDLGNTILNEIKKLKKDNILLKEKEKLLPEFETFYKKLEKNELLLGHFERAIDRFNGGKWKIEKINGKNIYTKKEPNEFKKVILNEIEKFEVWQNYRKNNFGTKDIDLKNSEQDFLQSINTALTFQLEKEIKLKNIEEAILFVKK